MAEQILSQNEIEALLAAVNEGELDLSEEEESRDRASDAAALAVKIRLAQPGPHYPRSYAHTRHH